MTLFNYKKFTSFSLLFFVLVPNPIFAESKLTKSNILKKSKECFKDFEYKLCSDLIFKMEKIQLVESEQNRYKCQSSILGLQTELIETYSFKKISKNTVMIPYVIKNCKFLK